MSRLILRLRTKIKDSQVTEKIELFSQLGFSVQAMPALDWTEEGRPILVENETELSGSSETSLNRESWSRLFGLLTSLSPTSLSLIFSGLSEQDVISPVSSLGTLFLANTYLQEIDEGLTTLTPQLRGADLEKEKNLWSRPLLMVESVLARFQNNGSLNTDAKIHG